MNILVTAGNTQTPVDEVRRYVEAYGFRFPVAVDDDWSALRALWLDRVPDARFTSASLLIQENADPTVRADMARYFERIAPEGAGYEHDDEGPDDMPAHLRTALTQTSLAVPVGGGRPLLGTWQAIYLFEHRTRPHRREIVLHLVGE